MTTRRLAVVLEVDDGDEEQYAHDYMVELVEDAGFASESVVSAIWLPSKNEPGPWGARFIGSLEAQGLVPKHTQRVVIEATQESWVTMHVSLVPVDGNAVVAVMPALLEPAQVVIHDVS